MVIDTSAFVAILFDEAERGAFVDILASDSVLSVSAVNFYEASLVIAARREDADAVSMLDGIIEDFRIEIAPVDTRAAMAARAAYFRFGKGYHPAKLNLADCFSYSLAKGRDEMLLFKGNDFLKTDIVPAWRP